MLLARTFGYRITCVEQAEEFHTVARRRVREARLDRLIELVHADARRKSWRTRLDLDHIAVLGMASTR